MIDYSNGYPVQITSNVNANTPWKEVFAMNPTKSNFTDWDFHFKDNPASGRVMEKCGLQYEGTLRQAGFANQGVCDIVVRSILKKDYQP